jgi:hypothetical protein
MLVRKRSVPALSSNANPDCVEAPRKVPHDFGTEATHPGVQTCGAGFLGAAAYSLKEISPTIAKITAIHLWIGFFTIPPWSISGNQQRLLFLPSSTEGAV